MPDNTTSHSQILCSRSQWTDVATFFLANFFAHVATVKSRPGEPPLRGALSMLLALVFPTSGVKRGLDAIFRHAIMGGIPLQKAKKAGALCEVIRARDWEPQREPQRGDVLREVQDVPTAHDQNLKKSNSLAEERKLCRKRDNVELLDVSQKAFNHDTSEQQIIQPQAENSAQAIKGVYEPTKTVDTVRGVQHVPTVHDQNLKQSNSLAEEGRLGRKRDDIELLDLPQNISNHDISEQQIIQPQVEISAQASTGVTEPRHEDRPASIDVFHVRNRSIGASFPRERVKPSYKMVGLIGRKVHGLCCLPQGFELSIVPSHSTVLELNDDDAPGEQRTPPTASASSQLSRSNPSDISSSYSFAKGIIAIFQTVYASATLYRTKGDQIERYGYAAFGLTVAPYLVMSIINLTGAVLTPDYPTLYMVESDIMGEARRRNGAFFGGTVGKLKSQNPVTQSSDALFDIVDQTRPIVRTREDGLLKELVLFYLTIAVGLTPVAINGILTRFRAGKSTHAQRVWTMTWLAFGVVISPIVELEPISGLYDEGTIAWTSFSYLFLYCGPAIGGFVVVGQMLRNYGHCIQISGALS